MAMMDNLKEMTIQDLLRNPTGKGSAQMAARKFIIQDLDARYYKLLMEHNKKLQVRCYKSKDDYLIHVLVPAEKYKGLYYDVLIQFTPHCENKNDSDAIKTDRTLNRYRLKLFSNSPNFMFTYTYVLSKNNMIIEIIKHKCSPLALTEAPTVRNPVESYGFEKSCYFACKYLSDMGYLNKDTLDANLLTFNSIALQGQIKSQEAKLKEYNIAQKQHRASVKEAKKTTKTASSSNTTKKKSSKSKKK